MFYNHLFWMAIALFLCAAININAYLEYHKTIRILPSIIGLAGLFGLVGWTIRLFSLAMTFNWWWMVGIGGASLIITGIFSYLTRNKISVMIGTINIVLIPFVWWYGSRYSYDVPFGWFYDIVDTVQSFFS